MKISPSEMQPRSERNILLATTRWRTCDACDSQSDALGSCLHVAVSAAYLPKQQQRRILRVAGRIFSFQELHFHESWLFLARFAGVESQDLFLSASHPADMICCLLMIRCGHSSLPLRHAVAPPRYRLDCSGPCVTLFRRWRSQRLDRCRLRRSSLA